MKLLNSYRDLFMNAALATLALVMVSVMAGCGDDDPSGPTQQQLQAELLSGQWQVSNFTAPDLSIFDYSDLTIAFTANEQGTGGTFTSTNAGRLFDGQGLWGFDGESTTAVIIDQNEDFGATAITIVSLTESALQVNVSAPEPSGRIKGLFGNYTFNFEK